MSVTYIQHVLSARAGEIAKIARVGMAKIVHDYCLYFGRYELHDYALVFGYKFCRTIKDVSVLAEPKWQECLLQFTFNAAMNQIANQLDLSAPLHQKADEGGP